VYWVNPVAVRLAYFSPTHTTERVLEAIARGARAREIGRIDLTPPAADRTFEVSGDELAIIGAQAAATAREPHSGGPCRRL